jgi:hypothetical protein
MDLQFLKTTGDNENVYCNPERLAFGKLDSGVAQVQQKEGRLSEN